MADQDELFLENLEEIVCDENKIITYKGLSSLLNVSANRAKEMLSIFVDQQSAKGNDLNVTFVLGGIPSDTTKKYRFLLVTRSHLEGMKSKFNHISCCHVYSVQRSCIKNFEILHNADNEMTKNSLFNLYAWSGIFRPGTQRRSAGASLKQTLEEPQVVTNGIDNKSSVSLAKPDVPSQREISSKSESSKPSLNAKQITSASFFGKNLKQKKGRESNQETSSAGTTKDARPSNQKRDETMFAAIGEEKKKLNYCDNPEEGKTHIRSDRRKEGHEKINKGESKEDAKDKGKDKEEEKKGRKKKGKTKEDETQVKQGMSREEETTEADDNSRFTKMKSKSKDEEEDISKLSKKKKRKKHEMEENSVKRRKTEAQSSESEEDDDFESFIKSSKECHSKPKKKREIDKGGEVSKIDKEVDWDISRENVEKNKDEKRGKECKQANKLSKTKKTVSSEKLKEEIRLDEVENKMADAEAEQMVVDEAKPQEKRRIRRKVLKSKTFMNEDGYMVTEKVYESESASGESGPEDGNCGPSKLDAVIHMKPTDITLENKKIKAEVSKNKTQSSLMSFFKKK